MDWTYKHAHSILPLPQCILRCKTVVIGHMVSFHFHEPKMELSGPFNTAAWQVLYTDVLLVCSLSSQEKIIDSSSPLSSHLFLPTPSPMSANMPIRKGFKQTEPIVKKQFHKQL